MKAVLYARVSTDKQAEKELSIPAQLDAMREYAKRHDWEVVADFVEPGASARTAQRPHLQRLLSFVREPQSAVDIVLVHKIDRLARNVYDHATIRALLKQLGIRLASVVENVDDTVSGELVENIMASIAQFYSANLGEEVKKGLQQKILRGEWPHLPPVGYVQVRHPSGRGSHVEVHPRLGAFITTAFNLYSTGHYSLHALAERLALDGFHSKRGTRLSQAQVQRILKNPFYAGRLRWKGQDLPAAHSSLTPMSTFLKAQEVMRVRYRHVGTKNSVPGFPLRGWALCAACRGRMTGERHERWRYYRCSRQSYKRERCNAKFCNAARAHQDLERICGSLQLTRKAAVAIQKAVRSHLGGRAANRNAFAERLKAGREQLEKSERQLTEAFAAGHITPDRFNGGIATIRTEQKHITRQIAATEANPSETLRRVERFLKLATSLWDVYLSFNDRKRVELLRTIFDKIVLGPSGVVSYTLTPTFQMLTSAAEKNPDSIQLAEALIGTTAA